MTGTYLECDYCKKHLDLEVSSKAITFPGDRARRTEAALKATKWITTADDLTFCCSEHARCYYDVNLSK